MHTDGVIQTYAIGGAVGATFYLEPMATEDVDVFLSSGTFNPTAFDTILERHNLADKLVHFKKQFEL